MTTTHYSDAQGNYLGGFSGGAQPPSGSVERPAPATGRDVWANGAWVTVVTTEQVNEERQRRLLAGVDVTLSDSTTVIPLQGRDEDMRNLHGLCTAAQLRIAGGDTTHQTTFRDRDNNDRILTPTQVVDLWSRGAAWVSSVYASSWAIKDLDPIPSDYAADSRWP